MGKYHTTAEFTDIDTHSAVNFGTETKYRLIFASSSRCEKKIRGFRQVGKVYVRSATS